MAESAEAVKTVEATELVMALASEVESREDEEDWETEAWSKAHTIEQLRSLPALADYSHDAHIAVMRFVRVLNLVSSRLSDAEPIEPIG